MDSSHFTFHLASNRCRRHAPVHGAVACTAIRYWVLQVQGRTPDRAAGFQPQSNRLVKKIISSVEAITRPISHFCSFYDITTSKIIGRQANNVFYASP